MPSRLHKHIWVTIEGLMVLCPVCREEYDDDQVELVDDYELEAMAEDYEDRRVVCDSCGEPLYYGG